MTGLGAFTAVAASVVAILASHAPAQAQSESEAEGTGSSFTALLTETIAPTDSGSGPVEGTSSSGVYYSHENLCGSNGGDIIPSSIACSEPPGCGDGGRMVRVIAHYPDGRTEFAGYTCIEPGEAEPQAVLTPGRILEAFRRIPVPSPSIGVNPVGGRTLVNFDTILHSEAEPFTETVQLLGRRVTFEIEPSEFSWRTGQGDGFTTSDPGKAYQASLPMSAYVTHRYLSAGDVQLGLDTTWTARWRVGDGPWRPVDGTVTTSSDPVPLEVVTARPQLVSYD